MSKISLHDQFDLRKSFVIIFSRGMGHLRPKGLVFHSRHGLPWLLKKGGADEQEPVGLSRRGKRYAKWNPYVRRPWTNPLGSRPIPWFFLYFRERTAIDYRLVTQPPWHLEKKEESFTRFPRPSGMIEAFRMLPSFFSYLVYKKRVSSTFSLVSMAAG